MAKFGARSLKRLKTCHPLLQVIMKEVVKIYDITILEGHRGKAAQNAYFKKGTSQLKYPKGNHNKIPSMAVDISPYPIDWKDLKRFHEVAGIVKAIAHVYGINIQWGGNWKRFKDYPHYELKNPTL